MNKKIAASVFVGAAFLALLLALIASTSKYFADGSRDSFQSLSNVTVKMSDKTESVSLPHTFSGLTARTAVTITIDAIPRVGDYLYVKSVYAPMKVYADGQLIYEYGQTGTYPAFMQDPATGTELVRLPRTETAAHLRLEYLSPMARNDLTVYPVLVGSQSAIFRYLCGEFGFSFLFAVLLLLSGLLLFLISLFITFFERSGIAFLWLGLFALAVGFWTFGECNLTGLFIRNPTILYLLAFTGLFILPVPLIHFGLSVVNFRNKKPLTLLAFLMGTAATVALLFQLLGLMPLERSMYLFHILEPLVLCFFAGNILYESLRYHNLLAQRFLVSMTVLAFFSILEVVNYRVHFTYIMSLFFQIGVLLFILITGIVGGIFIRDATRLRSKEQRLEFEMRMVEYSMEEQKKMQKLLMENQMAVRAQRHDLRHQLTVIRSFSERADNAKLTEYLDSLIAEIPSEKAHSYCENDAVNAIVSHYVTIGENQGIDFSVKLVVPGHTEQISDSSLCVIFGNILENAVEACNRMTEGHKFIRLRSRLQYNILTIAMDNSFDGKAVQKDELFFSSKRNEVGTGLQSVTAMAEKHGGGARFEVNGKVFLSSVYIRS